jgi:hypothetical protein
MEDRIEGEDAPAYRTALKRWGHLFDRRGGNPRTLWGRVPLPSLCLGLLGLGIFVGILLTHRRHASHLPLAGWLLAFAGFSLLGSLAMWSRTDYAESYGEPDPYAPLGYRPDKPSLWGRSELRNAPLYRAMAWIFTVLGLVLLIASGITEVVALLT